MRGYLGITAHILEENEEERTLQYSSYLLSCDRITGKHTGEHICSSYTDALKEYGIEHKIDFVVTDNASNMRKAFTVSFPACSDTESDDDDSEEEDREEDEVLTDIDDGQLWEDLPDDEMDLVRTTLSNNCRHPNRLSCFAHTLQLVVGDGIKDTRCVRKGMSKVSKISSLLHTSTRFKDGFEEAFGEEVGIPAANATRWNSTLRQVSAVLALDNNKMSELLDSLEHDSVKLSSREVGGLNELVKILDPFLQVTDETQAEKSVTISYVVPSVLRLHKHLSSMRGTSKYCQPIIDALIESLKKRFSGIFARVKMTRVSAGATVGNDAFGDPIYLTAAVLDPGWGFAWIDQDVVATVDEKERLKFEIKGLLNIHIYILSFTNYFCIIVCFCQQVLIY